MRVVELTEETWPALETLFGVNKTVGGCWCTWFLRDHKDVQAGWGEGNKAFLRARMGSPLGLLALDDNADEDQPAGWVAVAPRAVYPRLARSKVAASASSSAVGPDTWSVTCFFVHPKARRRGLAATLLEEAVGFARARGARSVEGYPVDTGGERRGSGDLYHGTLEMFLAAGFTLVDRRGTRRALVRRDLP